jgi:hypothetical protein
LDLTEVKANSDAIGITNKPFTIFSGHIIDAMVIHKNTIVTSPVPQKRCT